MAFWDSQLPHFWSFSLQGTSDSTTYPLPHFALPLVRPNTADRIVLPGGFEPCKEVYEFVREVLGHEDQCAVWTEDADATVHLSEEANSQLFAANMEEPMALMLPSYNRSKAELQGKAVALNGVSPASLQEMSDELLFRRMDDIDTPSRIQQFDPEINVPLGFICSNTDELLLAYARLEKMSSNWTGAARVLPVSHESKKSLIVRSDVELQLYDFPRGPVALVEILEETDGLYSASFFGGETLPVLEKFAADDVKFGFALSERGAALQDTVESWLASLWKGLGIDAATGTADFCVIKGQLILCGLRTNFTEELLVQLFCEHYASGSTFSAFYSTIPEQLDIWTFWARLMDNKIHFRPLKKTRRGIFPFGFCKGTRSLLVSIGASKADCKQYQATCDNIIHEPLEEKAMESVPFDSDVRRIWCSGPRPEYTRLTQRFNLSHRTIPLVRPKKDIILLPGGYAPGREYAEFCRKILGLDENQIIFTSGANYVLDDDIDEEILNIIRQLVATNPKDSFALVPYMVTAAFQRWESQLRNLPNISVVGESMEWINEFGDKGMLHRHIQSLDKPCLIERIAPNVAVAKGYTCSTVDDLLKAYELIGEKRVVIKPVLGAAGSGIIFVNDVDTLKRYDFPMGDVLLEEHLNLDTAPDGIVLSPAAHYMGSSLVQGLTDQIIVGTGYMGWRNSFASKSFLTSAQRSIEAIIRHIKPSGPGGFDFLSVDNLPILSDVNTGRFNGAHFPKLFAEMYGGGNCFCCWKHKPHNLDINTFWRRLESKGIALHPGKDTVGVFPLTFLKNLSGMYIAIAPTFRECEQIKAIAMTCLASDSASAAILALPPSPPELSLTLITNLKAMYAPQRVTHSSILIGGGKIVALLDDPLTMQFRGILKNSRQGRIIDGARLIAVPGIVDMHIHITGGGGENGPASRTREATMEDLVNAGVTTFVGVLGTDTISRSMPNLLTKCRGLIQRGLSGYVWTGGYPSDYQSMTGSLRSDICMTEQIIGMGELAVSDHRGAATVDELVRHGRDAHVAGLLSNKAGVVYCHMGGRPSKLEPLRRAVEESGLPISTFLPTHVNRSPELAEDAKQWVHDGGNVDITSGKEKSANLLADWFTQGVNLERVAVSSDGCGSLPVFDEHNTLIGYGCAGPNGNFALLHRLVVEFQWPLERALPLMTSNPARMLRLPHKGQLSVGADADILLLNHKTLEIEFVLARGNVVRSPTEGVVQAPLLPFDVAKAAAAAAAAAANEASK